MTTTEPEPATSPEGQIPPELTRRTSARVFAAELVIGVLIGLAVLAALVTGTAEIPFVYQGY